MNFQELGKFLGSCLVTFANRQSAEKFLSSTKDGLVYKGRKLGTKWEREFFAEKPRNNDQFNPDTIHLTVWVHGFDKQVMEEKGFSQIWVKPDGVN